MPKKNRLDLRHVIRGSVFRDRLGKPALFIYPQMEKASPQLEKGHTRLANELLEAIIRYPFSGAQLRVLFTIIRITYGWKKKKHLATFSYICFLTTISDRHVKRVIKQLVQDNVVLKEKRQNMNVLGINKDYYAWRLWKTLNAGGRIVTAMVTNSSLEK